MKKLFTILFVLSSSFCTAQSDSVKTVTKRAPVFGFRVGIFSLINPSTPSFQIQFEKSFSNNTSLNAAYGFIYASGLVYREMQEGTLGRLSLRHYYSDKQTGNYVSIDLLFKNFYYNRPMYVGYNCSGQNIVCDYYKVENVGFINNNLSLLGTWGFQDPLIKRSKIFLDISFSAGAIYKNTAFKNYSPKENTFADIKEYKRASNKVGDIGLDVLINFNLGIISYQK